jgi:acyl carrier protein
MAFAWVWFLNRNPAVESKTIPLRVFTLEILICRVIHLGIQSSMGLDGVEIVMKVEETFDIVIENSEAETTVTPGQLIELILSKVGRTSHAACLTQRAFYRLRAALVGRLGFARDQLKPDTSLAHVFPRMARKERVREILATVGLQKQIEFVRPARVIHSIWWSMLCGGIAVTLFFAWHPIVSTSLATNLAFGSAVISGALFLATYGWLAFFVTRRTRIEFRPSMKTLGHLSRWIVANGPQLVDAPPGEWSREQVSENVRQIVIDSLGCEKEYREDAHFVKDLGMS